MNNITLAKIQVVRYVGYMIWLIFMIMSIRVYTNNYLVVQNSIDQTQQEIARTQSENDFMKNFQIPYLQTDLAQRMQMHRQRIPQKWGLIVMLDQQLIVTPAWENPKQGQDIWVGMNDGRGNFISTQRRRSTQ